MEKSLKAQVRSGRLVLEAPVDLPDGGVVELQIVNPGDDEERAKLHQAIKEGWNKLRARQ